MDNAVITVKKGQALCIVIEGYEDHAATFDYDDVLQVILQKAQTDLNIRRNERQRQKYEQESMLKAQAYQNQFGPVPSTGPMTNGALGLYS